jgi:L-lactate dehydrogenase complex protein LldF
VITFCWSLSLWEAEPQVEKPGLRRARRELQQDVKASLENTKGRDARAAGFAFLRRRSEALIEGEAELAHDLRTMRLFALRVNRQLVEEAVARLRKNGIQVFLAASADEAVDYVTKVLCPPGLIVKSKSSMSRELHLSESLARAGSTVIETDLGDRINQLGGFKGAHLLAPSVSVGRDTVRGLLSREVGEELPDDTSRLVAAARRSLRDHFIAADYGLTGANAVVAETGTICLIENEGNIRAVTSLPKKHVAVAGIHKVVPTVADAMEMVKAAARFGSGQVFPTYVSLISGPGDGVSGPREVHLVLVDGGRGKWLAGPYGEAFACINCGACLNHCPVYSVVGDTFGGGRRVGGIGTLQTTLLEGRTDGERAGASLCIGCGKCTTVCPVLLDTPGLLDDLRSEGRPMWAPLTVRMVMAAVEDRRRLRRFGSLGRLYESSGLRRLARRSRLLKLIGLDEVERLLPVGSARARLPATSPAADQERARVLFFRGCLMDELMGSIHEDAVTVLTYNGCGVSVPADQVCCGAIHYHSGQEEKARRLARKNISAFEGNDVIITDSGGCGAFLKSYGDLLAGDPSCAEKARAFAERVRDISEFLSDVGMARPPSVARTRVAYHESCHLSLIQGVRRAPRDLLGMIPGVELVEMPAGEACCGSGGVWSLRHPGVASSLRLDRLRHFQESGAQVLVSNNPGCLLHLEGGKTRPMHLVELLARAYTGSPILPEPTRNLVETESRALDQGLPPDQGLPLEDGPPVEDGPLGTDRLAAALAGLRSAGWNIHRSSDIRDALEFVGSLAPGGIAVFDRSAEGIMGNVDFAVWSTWLKSRGVSGAFESATDPDEFRQTVTKASVGITGASVVVGETGTVFLAEEHGWGRLCSNLPYRHVVLAHPGAVVQHLTEGFERVREDAQVFPRYVSCISGASRTGDIDQQLVLGMHGPGEVYLVIVG